MGERKTSHPYLIRVHETVAAMKKIGKNKAPSVDGLMDIIFQKPEYQYIDMDG